jgi:hypothetical protein
MSVEDLLSAAAAAGLAGRIDAMGDVLDRGDPAAAAAELGAVARELEAAGVGGLDDIGALVRPAAIAARVARPDYGAVMAAIDERLAGEAAAGPAAGWGDQPEGQMYLQSLAAALVPLAGLDLDATRASARTFLANFPSVSLPFGDVDERAANWLARLHDSPAVRESLHALLAQVGDTWAAEHPVAAGQVRGWGSGPVPDDPTADGPWMRALVAIARTQL